MTEFQQLEHEAGHETAHCPPQGLFRKLWGTLQKTGNILSGPLVRLFTPDSFVLCPAEDRRPRVAGIAGLRAHRTCSGHKICGDGVLECCAWGDDSLAAVGDLLKLNVRRRIGCDCAGFPCLCPTGWRLRCQPVERKVAPSRRCRAHAARVLREPMSVRTFNGPTKRQGFGSGFSTNGLDSIGWE